MVDETASRPIRRLHDTGRSGWWYQITNEHDPNPKGVGDGFGYVDPQAHV